MSTYTLHLPRDVRPGEPDALENAELVKDGFTWLAFLFTPVWFFFQRLWLLGIVTAVGLLAFNATLAALDIHPAAGFLAQLLVSLLIGFEAGALKRWSLARRGRPEVDVVTASDHEEAETKAFARWLAGASRPRPTTPPATAARPPVPGYGTMEPVIGLFPQSEGRP